MKKLKLTINMRVIEDELDFLSYILTIGDGTAQIHKEVGPDIIQIPPEYLVDTMEDLTDKVFPNIED